MRITMRAVLHATSKTTGICLEALVGEIRTRKIVQMRQTAQWLCVNRVGASRARCGALFRRDHTTVMHAIREVDSRLREEGANGPTRALLDKIWGEAERLVKHSPVLMVEATKIVLPKSAEVKIEPPPPSMGAVANLEHGSPEWFAANDLRWRHALKQLSRGGRVSV